MIFQMLPEHNGYHKQPSKNYYGLIMDESSNIGSTRRLLIIEITFQFTGGFTTFTILDQQKSLQLNS